MNVCGSLIVATLHGSECKSCCIALGKKEFVAVFASVNGIECFAIEMSSATQNWLMIFDGQG